MYLLNMPYWYSDTREIHSPIEFFIHCGYLSLSGLGLSPSRTLEVVKLYADNLLQCSTMETDR